MEAEAKELWMKRMAGPYVTSASLGSAATAAAGGIYKPYTVGTIYDAKTDITTVRHTYADGTVAETRFPGVYTGAGGATSGGPSKYFISPKKVRLEKSSSEPQWPASVPRNADGLAKFSQMDEQACADYEKYTRDMEQWRKGKQPVDFAEMDSSF